MCPHNLSSIIALKLLLILVPTLEIIALTDYLDWTDNFAILQKIGFGSIGEKVVKIVIDLLFCSLICPQLQPAFTGSSGAHRKFIPTFKHNLIGVRKGIVWSKNVSKAGNSDHAVPVFI